MKTLSPSEEQALVTGVKQACDYVDDDKNPMSPDDALTKVARDNKWTQGYVRAGVNAFNNGRQVAQWQANKNVLDKLAEFPLADYDVICSNIWGGTQKQATDCYTGAGEISPEYQAGPTWLGREKSASAQLDIPSIAVPENDPEHQAMIEKHASDRRRLVAYSQHKDAKRDFEDARTKYASANDLVSIRLKLIENYFNKFAYDRLPFDVVDDAAHTYFGAHGRTLMDCVAESFPKEKRAADTRRFWDKPINLELAPFTYIKKAIDAAKDVYTTKVAMDGAEGLLKEAKDHLAPFSVAPQQNQENQLIPHPSLMGEEKQGSLMGAAAIGAGTRELLQRALDPGKTKQEMIEDEWLELEDPEHENEMRSIQAQAMLNQMMSDEDNPISGHDPDTILNAYNEIAALAPRTAGSSAALQPLLARRLAGNIEPFEVKEIADTEKSLKETAQATPDTNLLSNGPTQILG
jgi:hypothetical protein